MADPVSYTIYTDGSFRRPFFGSYAFIIMDGKEDILSECVGCYHTTNNRMELIAIREALKNTEPGDKITIYTDSQYSAKACAFWIKGWAKQGWVTLAQTPVANRDILEEIEALQSQRKVTYKWVRAHNGNELNERVDSMAQEVTAEMLAKFKRGEVVPENTGLEIIYKP